MRNIKCGGLCHGHFVTPINVEDRRKIFKFYPAGLTVEQGVVVCSLCWERNKNNIVKKENAKYIKRTRKKERKLV